MRIKPRRGAQYHCSRCFRLAVGSCDRSSRGHPGSDAITHGARTRMQFQRRRPFPIDGFDCETAAWEQRGAQWKRRFSIGFMHSLAGLVPEAAVGRVAGMTQDVGGRVGLRGAPGASRGELVDALLVLIPLEKRIPGMVSGSPPEKNSTSQWESCVFPRREAQTAASQKPLLKPWAWTRVL